GGFEAAQRLAGQIIGQFVERVADGEARGELGDRVTSGLRGQRRGARNARVHLDYDDAPGIGVDRELDVTTARGHVDSANDLDADFADLLVFGLRERYGWRDGNRIAGVDAHGVNIFNRAHRNDVIGGVAYKFELVFLPTEDRFFEQYL